MAANETPIGLALLVCDTHILDKHTNKRTLVGLFDRLNTHSLPCRHPALSVFVSLTSGRGEYDCEIVCRHAEHNEEAFHLRGKVRFKDPMQVVEMVFNVQGVRFQHAGPYWLECRVDEVPVMMRRLTIEQRQKDADK
jgi:hypothetical protein